MNNEIDKELLEEIKELKRAYHKQWRDNNNEKVKAKNQRYWAKRALALREQKAKEAQNGN